MIRRPPRSTLFPTRRSSDLDLSVAVAQVREAGEERRPHHRARRSDRGHPRSQPHPPANRLRQPERRDRKSTRLNSSHLVISYAVFCLKKKKNKRRTARRERN